VRVNKSRKIKWAGNAARRDICRVLVEKHEGKIKLEKTRPRWGDNIKMGLQ
jgi:hypothetical protein